MANREQFIAQMAPLAIRAGEQLGIDPRIIIAQSAQETGWGQHVPGGNYFGIKSHGQPGGATFNTNEVINGRTVSVNDSFRQYGSMADSVQGYVDFLLANPRYREMLQSQGLDAQLAALGRSGYATDPNYANAVGQIARSINLDGVAPAGGPGLMTTAGERMVNRPAGEVGPVQQRLQGGSPILERIRDRLRARGRESTPVLDAMIENRKRRAQTDRPLLNWMREQRQNAGYDTPFLDRILGNNTPATPVDKPPVVTTGSGSSNGGTGAGSNGGMYTVQNGDTLSAIANRNGIPLEQLIAANPQITNPGRISPGQRINLPGYQQNMSLWAPNNPTTLSAPPMGRPLAPSPTPQGTMGGWPVTPSPGFAPTPLAFHAPPASASQPTPYDATRNASPLRNDPGATVTKAPKQFSLSPQQGDPLMTAGMDLGTFKDLKTRQAALMNPNPTPKFPPPLGAEGIYAVTGQSTLPAAPRTTLPAGMPVATKPPVLSPVKVQAPALVAQKAAAQKLPYVPGK